MRTKSRRLWLKRRATPEYARLHNYRTLKQSSFDRTGGNHDSWRIEPGATFEVFQSSGPGIVTHIWVHYQFAQRPSLERTGAAHVIGTERPSPASNSLLAISSA